MNLQKLLLPKVAQPITRRQGEGTGNFRMPLEQLKRSRFVILAYKKCKKNS